RPGVRASPCERRMGDHEYHQILDWIADLPARARRQPLARHTVHRPECQRSRYAELYAARSPIQRSAYGSAVLQHRLVQQGGDWATLHCKQALLPRAWPQQLGYGAIERYTHHRVEAAAVPL